MSFIDSYANIVEYIEDKIAVINTLPASDAALVAAMANLLDGRNNPPSNMAALKIYLEGKELEVTDSSLVKDVTLLLGASLPSKNTVWKMREFLADDTFTVPLNIAGNVVYVTGCGGGGCGGVQQWNPAIGAGGSFLLGGAGGAWVSEFPFQVMPGQVIPVTIGAGGAGVSINDFIASPSLNSGTQTVFGSLTLAGGVASSDSGGFRPEVQSRTVLTGTGNIQTGPTILADKTGKTFAGNTSSAVVSTSIYLATGGACGLFGNGGNAAVSTTGSGDVTAQSAPANSGAGGGAALRYTSGSTPVIVTSGAGGSGRIIVEWQEFV